VEKKVEILFKSDLNISRRGRGYGKDDLIQDPTAIEYANSLMGNIDSCISSEWGSKLAKVWKCKYCNKICLISNLAFTSKFKKANKGIPGPGILYTTLNNESIFYRKHVASHLVPENAPHILPHVALESLKRKRDHDDIMKMDPIKRIGLYSSNNLIQLNETVRIQNLNIKVPIASDRLRTDPNSPPSTETSAPSTPNPNVSQPSDNSSQTNLEKKI